MDWSSLKVAELKQELKSRGLSQTGKKAELIARLEEYEDANNKTGGDEAATEDAKEIETTEEPVVEPPPPQEEEEEEEEGTKKGEEEDKKELDEGKVAGQIFKHAISDLNDKKRKSSSAPEDSEDVKKAKTTTGSVPESTTPGSRALLVIGFQRPFTLQAARALLEESGKVMAMWMPTIKDRAYVVYGTKAEAEKASQNLWGITWPANSTKTLEASFVSVCDAERSIRKGGGNPDFAIERTEEDPEDEPAPEEENNKEDKEVVFTIKNHPAPKANDSPKDAVDVASLFRSTKASPMIYWTTCKPFTPK
ncbi:hypothetical protein M9435_001914 [Picochlorum sp. BPE23]|nr:hypothetical protein M9435_001914 [Picochlorum sp. BPE23]